MTVWVFSSNYMNLLHMKPISLYIVYHTLSIPGDLFYIYIYIRMGFEKNSFSSFWKLKFYFLIKKKNFMLDILYLLFSLT